MRKPVDHRYARWQEYRRKMDADTDLIRAHLENMRMRSPFSGFRFEDPARPIPDRDLIDLEKEALQLADDIRWTREAIAKDRQQRAEAEQRLAAYSNSRKPEEVQ